MELIGRKKYIRKCPGCNNHYYSNIKGNHRNKYFFKFSRNVQYHQIWRNVCNVDGSKKTTNWQLCENHFSRRDFVNDAKHSLISDAVPLPCLCLVLPPLLENEVNSKLYNLQDHNYCKFWQS